MTNLTLAAALVLAAPTLAPSAGPAQPTLESLRAGFRTPPPQARVMMRWWWFGPAVTSAGIERELRLMKEGGLGGVEVQPVYPLAPDDPPRLLNLPFLSPKFGDALGFAAEKSRELGLRFDLTLGSGWPFGGASVGLGDAAGRLRIERVKVQPGARRVVVPALTSRESLLASYVAEAQGSSLVPESLRPLDPPAAGASLLPQNAGPSTEAVYFISSRTGMMVKRPAIGGEGYVLDHYSRGATDRYLASVGEPLLGALNALAPEAVFCDSLEVYGSDWTDDLPAEFLKRRGYDLLPHLPALAVDGAADATRIRRDWGLTLTEMLEERFMTPLAAWAQARGTRLRAQAYGIPPARLSTNALVDLPEGEGSAWKTLTATRWASSAAHLFGRPVTSSETWTWLHSPAFRATPLDLKAEADLHFLQGVNQLIGHGWPYTAEGEEYPGWRFYAAGVFNEKNPWWIAMPDLALYLQRVSFLLRQGSPVADVAVYLPQDDAWGAIRPGQAHLLDILRERMGPEVLARLLEAGHSFDLVDDQTLERLGPMMKGRPVLGPGGYRMVVLPGVEAIPPATYRRLASFVEAGGLLVATRRLPETAPGLRATADERSEVAALSKRLFEGAGHRAHLFQSEGPELAARLRQLLVPDVDFGAPTSDLGYVHRSWAGADLYFLVNTTNQPKSAALTLRAARKGGEWWDPVAGTLETVSLVGRGANRVSTTIELPPYGSRVLVLSDRNESRGPGPVAGKPGESLDLSSDWRVSFQAQPQEQTAVARETEGRTAAGTQPTLMPKLHSWADDEATRYFSGTVAYEKEVVLPKGSLGNGRVVRLELGAATPLPPASPKARFQALLDSPVRDAAVVTVNGSRAGSVWCPPYALDVTEHVVEGRNAIRILVGNTALNHMAGRALPDYKLLHLRYGQRFDPQDMAGIEPRPSGLLGPIRLVISSGPSPAPRAKR